MSFKGRLYQFARRGKYSLISICLSLPRRVVCNVCDWRGRRFMSDTWHKNTICPRCSSAVRHRLFVAALRKHDRFNLDRIAKNRRVLHFAPEPSISSLVAPAARRYVTADFLRKDCDMQLDMSDMREVQDGEFDTVLAFDVLEHVPDFSRALVELRRVLSSNGVAVLTVPQRDDLATTDEDPTVVSPEARTARYGQSDHLRMFGRDFSDELARHGFRVSVIDETSFTSDMQRTTVLFPPSRSDNPLATNFRKVFFCER